MGEKKRKGRKAYLNDFHPNLQGDYIYTGKHFRYTGETPWKTLLAALWLRTLVLGIGIVVGGFLPAAGMNGTFYVVAPYLASIIAGTSVVWAMVRLGREGKLRSYVYEVTVLKLPIRAKLTAIAAIAAVAGEGINLAVNGFAGRTAVTVLYLLLEAAAAAAAWSLSRRSAAMDWEEWNDPGTDIGL